MTPVLRVICDDMSGLRPQLSMVAQLRAVSRLSRTECLGMVEC